MKEGNEMVNYNASNAVSKEYLSKIENWVRTAATYSPEHAGRASMLLYLAQLGADKNFVQSMGSALAKDIEQGGKRKDIEIRAFKNQYGVRFVDYSGQLGEFCIYRGSNGMPYIRGNKEMVPLLMGRGELDVAFRRMVDGEYFNDK